MMNGGEGEANTRELGVEQEEQVETEEAKNRLLLGGGHGFQAGLVSLGVGGGSESEDSDPSSAVPDVNCAVRTCSVEMPVVRRKRGGLQWGRCDRRTVGVLRWRGGNPLGSPLKRGMLARPSDVMFFRTRLECGWHTFPRLG